MRTWRGWLWHLRWLLLLLLGWHLRLRLLLLLLLLLRPDHPARRHPTLLWHHARVRGGRHSGLSCRRGRRRRRRRRVHPVVRGVLHHGTRVALLPHHLHALPHLHPAGSPGHHAGLHLLLPAVLMSRIHSGMHPGMHSPRPHRHCSRRQILRPAHWHAAGPYSHVARHHLSSRTLTLLLLLWGLLLLLLRPLLRRERGAGSSDRG